MCDCVSPVTCVVVRSRGLCDFGSDPGTLDTCSSAPVTNVSSTVRFTSPNYKSDVRTLGGWYRPPVSGLSDAPGNTDYDDSLGVTTLSQRTLELSGATVTRVNDTFYLRLKNCPVTIVLNWTDDTLAGGLTELGEYNTHTVFCVSGYMIPPICTYRAISLLV